MEMNLMDLLAELKTLIDLFQKYEIEYALCGGLAMAIYARPRATLDIDVMIEGSSLEKTKDILTERGYSLSSTPMTFKNQTISIQRLTKIDPRTEEHLSVDLLIVTPDIQAAWDSRQTVEWEGGPLNVVSPEGLILLKSFRKSGQDRDDIDYLRSILNED